jgi:hypothetical protein
MLPLNSGVRRFLHFHHLVTIENLRSSSVKSGVFATVLVCIVSAASVHAEVVPAKQAREKGFTTCQSTVEKVAEFVIKDNSHGGLSTWNSATPDERMFNSQVGLSYSDGKSVAIINVAPTKSGKCDASYTTIFADAAKSCSVLRETTFSSWRFHSESAGMVVLENDDGSLSKILMPSGNGCVSITTEVVYQ